MYLAVLMKDYRHRLKKAKKPGGERISEINFCFNKLFLEIKLEK